ncbi:MAG: integrase arm-type DNA-binding domain-containing protein [Siculibacillus sp.]|nr:integrase arm-type DNA-binding domain-containing protein [Siculibacillus sp.]
MARYKLSDRAIRAAVLPDPAKGERVKKLADGASLFLVLGADGSRRWSLEFRSPVDQKRRTIGFGVYPEVGLAEARKRADEARALVRGGVDPSGARKLDQARTFRALAQRFLEVQERSGRRKSTLGLASRLLGPAIEAFGDRDVSTVTAADVLGVLRRIEARGSLRMIEPTRAHMSRVFGLAMASGFIVTDPAAALKRGVTAEPPPRTPRAAAESPEEFGELLRRVWSLEVGAPPKVRPETKALLQLLAFAAVRPGEARGARWSEIDLEAGVWEIPAARTKMKRAHRVPLPALVVELLTNLRKVVGRSPWLFPARVGGPKPGPGYIGENVPSLALRRLGYEKGEITAHGFRASFSTLAHAARLCLEDATVVPRWPSEVVERALAHVDANAIRAAYNRNDHWAERVELAAWWAETCEGLRLEAEARHAGAAAKEAKTRVDQRRTPLPGAFFLTSMAEVSKR